MKPGATPHGCSVRASNHGDLAAVSALVDRSFFDAEGYFLAEQRRSKPELRQGMESARTTIFVADHGWVWAPPKCVGAVRVDVPDGSPEAYMAMLAVAPEQQRQGIGRLLVQQAEAMAHSRGCKGMNLHASTCRTTVLAFYESLGYKVVGNEPLPEQVSHMVRPEYNTARRPFMTTHFRKELAGLQIAPSVQASIASTEAAVVKRREEVAAEAAAEVAQAKATLAAAEASAAQQAEIAASVARERASRAAAAAAEADAAAQDAVVRAEHAAKEAFKRTEEERVAALVNEARGQAAPAPSAKDDGE